MSRTLLLVSYYFPPHAGAPVMRVMKLAKYLPRLGWKVVVLTSDGKRYVHHDPALLEEVRDTVIVRAPSLEPTAPALERRLQQGGSATLGAALGPLVALKRRVFFPDERAGWIPSAVLRGAAAVRRHRPDVILSSAPAFSSHLAASLLARVSGLPWVADFRESWMLNHLAPERRDPLVRWTEAGFARTASAFTAVTPAIVEEFVARYPGLAARCHWIPNGYDPEDACHLGPSPGTSGPFTLTALGIGRHHPRSYAPLLEALKAVNRGEGGRRVRLQLVGGAFAGVEALAQAEGLAGEVEVVGTRPYREALALLGGSQASLLMLGAGEDSRLSLPTAIFDCLLARKPILALATGGYAADLVRASGLGRVVAPDDAAGIRAALATFAAGGVGIEPDPGVMRTYDRAAQAGRFAEVLDRSIRDRDKRARP